LLPHFKEVFDLDVYKAYKNRFIFRIFKEARNPLYREIIQFGDKTNYRFPLILRAGGTGFRWMKHFSSNHNSHSSNDI
jgi:hypothetical protein